jgi:uncharacterized protein HemY
MSLLIYAIIAIVILVLLIMLLRNIRFLYSRTPEQNAQERIENRGKILDGWRRGREARWNKAPDKPDSQKP